MKIPTVILIALVSLAAGFVAADALAYHFAKQHGVPKYGGLFQRKPTTGPSKADAVGTASK